MFKKARQAKGAQMLPPHCVIREFNALTGVTLGVYVRSKQRYDDPTLRSAEDVAPPSLA